MVVFFGGEGESERKKKMRRKPCKVAEELSSSHKDLWKEERRVGGTLSASQLE